MKKVLLIVLLAMVTVGFIGESDVEAKGKGKSKSKVKIILKNNKNEQLRDDARHVLRRTARVLERSQKIANDDRRRGRHRRGRGRDGIRYRGLGRAFAHQERARDLYNARRYELAIDHSLQARAIALRVIRRANDWDRRGWRDNDDDYYRYDMDRRDLDDCEYRYWERRRSNRSELEADIRGVEISDEIVVDFRIELNF